MDAKTQIERLRAELAASLRRADQTVSRSEAAFADFQRDTEATGDAMARAFAQSIFRPDGATGVIVDRRRR